MRTLFVVGKIEPRGVIPFETREQKIARLEAAAAKAHEEWIERRNHFNEIRWHQAAHAVDVERGPEVA